MTIYQRYAQANGTGRAAGAHHGGINPAAGLHTTFRLVKKSIGQQVGHAFHVVHDGNVLEDSE